MEISGPKFIKIHLFAIKTGNPGNLWAILGSKPIKMGFLKFLLGKRGILGDFREFRGDEGTKSRIFSGNRFFFNFFKFRLKQRGFLVEKYEFPSIY